MRSLNVFFFSLSALFNCSATGVPRYCSGSVIIALVLFIGILVYHIDKSVCHPPSYSTCKNMAGENILQVCVEWPSILRHCAP